VHLIDTDTEMHAEMAVVGNGKCSLYKAMEWIGICVTGDAIPLFHIVVPRPADLTGLLARLFVANERRPNAHLRTISWHYPCSSISEAALIF